MSDFWTRKLGGPQYGRSGRREYGTSSPPPAPAPAAPAAPEVYAPIKAQHLRESSGACPNCASGDYIRAGENYKPRCYACGYPVLHSTSGMVATKSDPRKVKPARQLAMSMNGDYSPQKIIGRID